jgi:Dienelactone hydrolase family
MRRELAWARALIGAAALCLAVACDEDDVAPTPGSDPGGFLSGGLFGGGGSLLGGGGLLGGDGSIGGGTAAGGGGILAGGGGTVGGGGGTSSCPGLPDVASFDTTGPFADVVIEDVPFSGAGEGCTLFRPGSSLGANGFKHPIAVWGNGIITTPDMYTSTLSLFASHGFVTIACNSSYPERPCLNECMDWLVQQNASGAMAGKLDTSKEITLGYSWGGGAAIDTANRPNVKATVSFHGMPPREFDPFGEMHGPLLLFTSTGDTFVSASAFVTPNYNSSQVQTFYATMNNDFADHLYIIDGLGNAELERGAAIAWMRVWACGDQAARRYFWGNDCVLCRSPFSAQRKNWL